MPLKSFVNDNRILLGSSRCNWLSIGEADEDEFDFAPRDCRSIRLDRSRRDPRLAIRAAASSSKLPVEVFILAIGQGPCQRIASIASIFT